MTRVVSRTVEVCVFKRDTSGPHYLVLRRSEFDSLYPGMWQLVTGTMLDGEQAVDAAKREFREETGLAAVQIWVVPFVNSFYVADNDTVHMSPLFAVEVNPREDLNLSHEHQDFAWCTFDDAISRLVWPGQRQGLQIVRDYIVGGQEASRLLTLTL